MSADAGGGADGSAGGAVGSEGRARDLERAIAAALARARAAWPTIVGDDAAVRQALAAAAAGASDDAEAAIAALCVDDLYLARACAAGDPAALAAFEASYLARIPAYLARHPARGQVDEVRQRLRARLLVASADAPPRIADYAGRGSLASWLRVAAIRVAGNLVRDERVATDAASELADAGGDGLGASALFERPELAVLAGRYQAAFRAAFRAAFAGLPAEQRAALKLHFLDGVTVRGLAPILGVSSATAGRRLLAAQRELADAVLAALAVEVAAPVDELASAVRALVSRLDVSLSALTAEP